MSEAHMAPRPSGLAAALRPSFNALFKIKQRLTSVSMMSSAERKEPRYRARRPEILRKTATSRLKCLFVSHGCTSEEAPPGCHEPSWSVTTFHCGTSLHASDTVLARQSDQPVTMVNYPSWLARHPDVQPGHFYSEYKTTCAVCVN